MPVPVPFNKPATLKFYNPDKGYGFLVPEGGGDDIFVHLRRLEASGLTPDKLKAGDRIKIITVTMGNPKGPQAYQVELMG